MVPPTYAHAAAPQKRKEGWERYKRAKAAAKEGLPCSNTMPASAASADEEHVEGGKASASNGVAPEGAGSPREQEQGAQPQQRGGFWRCFKVRHSLPGLPAAAQHCA